MVVGVCSIEFYIDGAMSLKDKRMVIRSIKDRLKFKFNVSVAEVGENDNWRIAQLGITCVSNSGHHVDSMISGVINFLEKDVRIRILDYYTEQIHI
ncbi:MAG TPA: DUF503 domain-containing protein [Clostridiales bacterium]|nr:DUF503 domain-containing protein [Clostridiales bacterium]